MKVKVNYLAHSSFAVETENYLLIFDYFLDEVESGEKCIANGAVGQSDLKTNKKIFVFSSHKHFDHFNPIILEWAKINSKIKYVLNKDIRKKYENENIYKIANYETIELDGLKIKAYGSTDRGGSFLVTADGVDIFHAGDLNWWLWWDDSDKNKEKATKKFRAEIKRIIGENIDIAFFPVDPRLEHKTYLGVDYFVSKVKPKYLIPMHFGEDYEAVESFYKLTHRGQELAFEF